MENQPFTPVPTGNTRLGRLAVAAVAAAAGVSQLWIVDRSAVPMDEGHLAAAASRILGGEVLYRDIHTGIAPGIYHFTAGLFALFGEDLLVTRWSQWALNVAIAVCLWRLAVRVVRIHWAVLAPALYLLLVVVAFPVLTMLNYSSLSLACALGALLFAQRYLEAGRVADGVVLGLLLAFTALAKQNFGVLAIAAVGGSLLWNRGCSALADRSRVSAALPVVGSAAVAALATVVVFASEGALMDLLNATLIDVGGPQLAAFNNPIPPLFGSHPQGDPRFMFLYTPPTLFNHMLRGGTVFGEPVSAFLRELSIRLSYGLPMASLAAATLALWLTRGEGTPLQRGEARGLVAFGALFFLGIFPSAIWSHLAFVVAPTLVALAIALDRLEGLCTLRFGAPRRVAAVAAGALAVACLAVCLRVGWQVRSWYPEPLGLPHATLFVNDNQAALYRGAVEFLDGCAAEGEAVFVAPDIPLLYFLSERPNPTRYDLTIPGNVDGSRIVRRLEEEQTRCVVYNPRMYPEFPPFEVLFPALNRHLKAAYRRAAVISGVGMEWRGLVRRNAAP
ncbi:MAG: ArnT family glycosyltransferase [Myxococcota bacterium]